METRPTIIPEKPPQRPEVVPIQPEKPVIPEIEPLRPLPEDDPDHFRPKRKPAIEPEKD